MLLLYLPVTTRGAAEGSLFIGRVTVLKVRMITLHCATQLVVVRLALQQSTEHARQLFNERLRALLLVTQRFRRLTFDQAVVVGA